MLKNYTVMRDCRNCGEKYLIQNSNQLNCTVCINKYGKDRLQWLWKRYSATAIYVEDLLKKQRGSCAICDKDIKLAMNTEAELQACVDHDHVTNKIRGILCRQCNRSLGQLGDSIESIERVLTYLKENT